MKNKKLLNKSYDTLLRLIRIAVSGKTESIPSGIDWMEVIDVATKQGVLGIAYDAIEILSNSPLSGEKSIIDIDSLMEWMGQVNRMETAYKKHRETVRHLSEFYDQHGIRMMLLKGYGLSLLWPNKEHRPTGDIDVYLRPSNSSFKDDLPMWQEADMVIHDELGIEVDNGHHHHSVFTFEGTMVENHYDFINVHSHKSNVEIENTFKRLAESGCKQDKDMQNVYYPSDMLNMLFVARHNAIHFASEKITLRMVLDWAFLNRKVDLDLNLNFNWQEFWDEVKKMGMLQFVLCMNALCVKYLGFEKSIFHEPVDANIDDSLVKRMLKDIFEPEDTGADKKGLSYLAHRTRLWLANDWKNKMVYSDSRMSTFCYQMKSHLMKPKTIFGV